ncbi:NifU family protein [Streptomyces varsoviensis]|uniref:NifU family protein n=1 Tax=Streptomyces varsoviensis TaxID=67373 RepID=UPI0004C4A9E4|nr:NifU family protein [Streptomyces varsoviensis]
MSSTAQQAAARTAITVTDAARAALRDLAQPESGADRPALFVSVESEERGEFRYEFAWRTTAEAGPGDLTTDCEEFTVVVPEADAGRLAGATLDADPQFGVVISNPNAQPEAAPESAGAPAGPDDDELRARVEKLFAETVNPALASHSGAIKLERIEDGVLYVSLLGGCQGCSGAALTLADGIERFIVDAMPQIRKIVDVTNHAAGTAPFLR